MRKAVPLVRKAKGRDAPLPPSAEVMRIIRKKTDTVVLSFSGGKDSLACWLALREAKFKVIPVHHYIIPDLGESERFLHECEKYFDTEIIRTPHNVLYQLLAAQTFQPPHMAPILEHFDFPSDSTLGELKQFVIDDEELPEDTWVAVGTRAADSSSRRLFFSWHGAIRENNRTFFPIWDWRKETVFSYIAKTGLKLPDDYSIWGRSFDGIDYFFLKGLRDNRPKDYAKVKELLPLVDLEFARFEIADSEGLLPKHRTASRG